MHRGQFYMGDITGMVVNIIAVAWLIFAIVFFSFPYYMPVTRELYPPSFPEHMQPNIN